MIKRIIFLVKHRFNRRDYRRFGIELLEQNGFGVEVWQLANILAPKSDRGYASTDQMNWPGYKTFNSKQELLSKLKGLGPDTFIVFISLIRYNLTTYPIFKAISDTGARYALSVTNAVPLAEKRAKRILYNFERFQKITWRKSINYLNNTLSRIPLRWMGVKPSNFLFAGGERSIKHCMSGPIDRSTKILWAHSMDYDQYLEEKRKHFSGQPIAVFLDEYVPFHPDYKYCGTKAPISADKYYPMLNKLFKLVEDRLKLKVIIAAHPHSRYEDHPDCFEGRKWFRRETVRLVKESKLVLAHSSTALNFANLFHKPVIFLTSSELDKSWQGSFIRAMSGWFAKKPIFMDKPDAIDWQHELITSKSHYRDYHRAYIKKDGSRDLPFWQIVADALKTEKFV